MKHFASISVLTLFVISLSSCQNKDAEVTNCEIFDLQVVVGGCTSENTYELTLDFEYENPGNNSFDVFVRDSVFMGNYMLSELPLTIGDFETSGLEQDYIKVCINDNPDCCEDIEFLPPNCP